MASSDTAGVNVVVRGQGSVVRKNRWSLKARGR